MRRGVGLPAVVKPVMSSSGKGQSVARTEDELGTAFDYAVANMRGDRPRVIVEQFIDFDYEITLLTVATKDGVLFCPPIGHRQEGGDYRESWQPAPMEAAVLASAQKPGGQGCRRRLAGTACSGSNSSSPGTRRSSPNCRPDHTTPAWSP